MPKNFYVGLFLFFIGIILTMFTYFKYTREVHQKEIEKNQWAKKSWYFCFDLNLFVRLGEKSYILAKLVIMLTFFAFALFGAFVIWDSLVNK